MSKRTLLGLTVLLLAYVLSMATLVGATSAGSDLLPAQVCGIPGVPACTATPPPPRDSDGDGVPDTSDGCPGVPGPASNGGCPEPTPAPTENDSDGDGTPNDVDRCPDQGGPADNGGCPVGEGAETTPIPTVIPILLPALPSTGDCMLATQNAEGVNVRGEPSLDGTIVGALDPTLLYPAIASLENADGVWDWIAEGWVASWVVRAGGDCGILPYVNALGGPDTSPELLDTPFEFELVGVNPGPVQLGTRFCQNNLHVQGQMSVDPSNPNSNAIIIDFNIGAAEEAAETGLKQGDLHLAAIPVQGALAQGGTSTEWCIEGFADGHLVIDWNIGTADPPEPGTPQGLVIDWHAGLSPEGNELMIIAVLESPLGEAEDQAGHTLTWILPYNPDAQGLVVNWNIGMVTPPDPSTPQGIIIDWSVGEHLPEVVHPEGDTAGSGQPPEPDAQGIIIDYLPGMVNPPDPSAPQGIIIEWFPNGVDPDAQGIIVDYMPGGLEFIIPYVGPL